MSNSSIAFLIVLSMFLNLIYFLSVQHEHHEPEQASYKIAQPVSGKQKQDVKHSLEGEHWCQWALGSKGGVVRGKSWGNLDIHEQHKYVELNCDTAAVASLGGGDSIRLGEPMHFSSSTGSSSRNGVGNSTTAGTRSNDPFGKPPLSLSASSPATATSRDTLRGAPASMDASSTYIAPSKPLPLADYKPVICNAALNEAYKAPMLKQEDVDWCKWALTAGKVVVGSSWGILQRDGNGRRKFEELNCNTVGSTGKNPTCEDSWGDSHISNWVVKGKAHQNNQNSSLSSSSSVVCANNRKSSIKCMRNENMDNYCELTHAQIDFSKYKSSKKSKEFSKGFFSIDCNSHFASKSVPEFTFPDLLSLQYSKPVCDVHINGTVLLYSHDNINNVAHTINDKMNVWVMLWLSGLARHSKEEITFLNVDSLSLHENYDDAITPLFDTYKRNFKDILRGMDYKGHTVCMDKLLVPIMPPRPFVWDGWDMDKPCSFKGPSSLYQRWNMHVRNSYNLLSPAVLPALPSAAPIDPAVAATTFFSSNRKFKVVLIVRRESKNDWGSYRSSRLFKNEEQLASAMKAVVDKAQKRLPSIQFELVVKDLAKITFKEQVQLMSETSILTGMHGAGISLSNYMSVGHKLCCGVMEFYPKGEFSNGRFFPNMVRKMGIHYSRIDIDKKYSEPAGATVPVEEMAMKLEMLMQTVIKTPSCVLPQVLSNPYLDHDTSADSRVL